MRSSRWSEVQPKAVFVRFGGSTIIERMECAELKPLSSRPHLPAVRRNRRAASARDGRSGGRLLEAKHAHASRPQLVVFVKEPQAGRVKTRLARGIGTTRATQFYRHTTSTVLARLAADPRWRTVIAIAPDTAVWSRAWGSDLDRVGQGHGDLGRRLQRLMDGLPPGPVVAIGTDIPGIRPAHIAAALKCLGSADAVFGPAPDGGYWLVGLKRLPRVPKAFRQVRWSSEHALADTRANLAGLDVKLLGELLDVDEAADLPSAQGVVGRRVLSPERG